MSDRRPVINMPDWMRDVERRILSQERRNSVVRAADLMGPGLGPTATLISDWSKDTIDFNGIYFSDPGAFNSPSGTYGWMGTSWATPDGAGFQRVTVFPVPPGGGAFSDFPGMTYVRQFSVGAGEARSYTPWQPERPMLTRIMSATATINTASNVSLGLTSGVNVSSSLENWTVMLSLDVEHTGAGSQTLIVEIQAQSTVVQTLRFTPAGLNLRLPISSTIRAVNLTPGPCAFEAYARLSGTPDTFLIYTPNSQMSVLRTH